MQQTANEGNAKRYHLVKVSYHDSNMLHFQILHSSPNSWNAVQTNQTLFFFYHSSFQGQNLQKTIRKRPSSNRNGDSREREREFTHTRIARWKRKCSTQQIPASEIGFLHYQSFQFNAYISNPTDKKKTKTKKWIYREGEKERDLWAWVWNTGKQHKGLHVWCCKGGDGSAQWDLEVALMLSSDFCINLSFLWFLLPNFPLLPFSASQLWFCGSKVSSN